MPDAQPNANAIEAVPLTGTANQIEWATDIRNKVNLEFDRVARALASVREGQSELRRTATVHILGILAEIRAEVMANERAGYYIHDWQERGSQVRTMLLRDVRYLAVVSERHAAEAREKASIS